METYEAMRQFADSWGLVGMMAFFLTAVVSLLGRSAGAKASAAARIPLEDTPVLTKAGNGCSGTCTGDGPCERLAGIFDEERLPWLTSRLTRPPGTETTGHEWDGIQELNTPLPRWWLHIFYATIVFSVGYMIAYPAIPLINSATEGVLGHTNRKAVAEAIAEHASGQAQYVDAIAVADFDTIRADADLAGFARKAGASAYAVNCSQCHGAGAQGAPGYPNLNDDAWIWGGSTEQIYQTIKHGVRNADSDDDARLSEMPAFGADGILTRSEIADVTQYRTVTGQPGP